MPRFNSGSFEVFSEDVGLDDVSLQGMGREDMISLDVGDEAEAGLETTAGEKEGLG